MRLTKYAVFLTSFLLLAAAAPAVPNAVGIRPAIAAAAAETPEIVASGTLCATVTWQLDKNGTLTVTGSGDMSEMNGNLSSYRSKIKKAVIQNTDAAHTLTAIGAELFRNCSALTEVTLPDTIEVIGYRAFSGCSSLSICNFPDSLKEIGEDAFYETALTELTLPGCALGKEAFYGCKSLKTLTINNGTESIPAECFRFCKALESVTLPDSVQSINCGGYADEGAFNSCPALKTVSIGSGITAISRYAFDTNGTELEITFREGVTAIPDESFNGRTELTKVVLPDSLKKIGTKAFADCSNLSSCNFPDNLTEIGEDGFKSTALTEVTLPGCALGREAFYDCKALKTVTIKEGTESIPAECFRFCKALESVTLPDSVQSINCGGYGDEGAFNSCPALKTVSIGSGITYIDKNAFQTNGTDLEVTFRKGVTAIPDESFYKRTELTKVVLPDTLKTIGARAFADCSNLSSCNFPDNLTEIGEDGFKATALTKLTLPGCALGREAFYGCKSLKTVKINNGTENIPAECFRYCTALESVTLPDSVQSINCGGYDDEGAFNNCPELKTVSIGSGITYIDKNAFQTKGSDLEVIFREGVTAIPAESFKERTELTKVVLPDSLKTVGKSAFLNCSNLSVCNFPDGLAKIQAYAFNGTGLTELTLPGCALERAAFKSCESLVSVAFNEGTESIPAECFRNCTALENVTLPDSVQSIECGGYNDEGAFFNCKALESVSIGTGITYIHKNAFWTKSPNLEVIFREGVTAIPEHAFDSGTVAAIILPKTVKTIGQNDISGYANLKLISIQAPDCVIADAAKTIPSAAKIRGSENSTAHAYAEKYNRNFVTFENDEVIAYSNRVLGISLSLDGKIGLDYHVKLCKDAAKVVLWCGSDSETYTGEKLAAAKLTDGTYQFSIGVSAAQASEIISMKIYTADGKSLDIYNSEYEKLQNKTARYSVNDYIADVTKYQNDAKLKAMVNALDQYCKSAENFFGVKAHDDLRVAAGDFSAYQIKKTGSSTAKIALILESETSIRISYSGSGAVTYGGKALEKEGNYYYLRNIPAHLLGSSGTLVVGSARYENLSALSYGSIVLKNSSDPKLKTLVNALYAYAKAAEAYAAAN